MSIILSDFNLVFPPQSSMPKEQGTFVLMRLTQFPSRDENRNIIDGEFTNCCFTSAFGSQTNLTLPDGKTLALTVSKWRRNTDGNITNPTSGDQLTFWFDDSEEEKLKYCIAENILYVYGDTANPDSPPMLPDTYLTHVQRLKSQTIVQPITTGDPTLGAKADVSGH